MIDARGLQKSYQNCQKEIRPLDGVDFACDIGEFVLVTGRSGAGKTTFLNVLSGLTLPTAGSVTIAGHDLLAMTDYERSVLRSEMMGFVFQFPGLMAPLTVLENVLLPATLKGKAGMEAKARDLLEQVGLLPKADAYPAHLSGGAEADGHRPGPHQRSLPHLRGRADRGPGLPDGARCDGVSSAASKRRGRPSS